MTADQEIRRVLRRLAGGARLMRLGTGFVFVGKNGRRAKETVDAALVALLQTRDLVREQADGLVLAPAGESWLKRAEASQDPYAAQHRLLNTRLTKDSQGRDCYVVVNAAESPLAALHCRGLVSAAQFEAGEKLRRDCTLGQLTPRMGVDLSMPAGRRSGAAPLSDTVLAAKQRFNRALRAVGPELSGVLFDVCCDLRGLEESERARGWPRASAKVVLRLALDRLAAHYGMLRRASSPIRSWSAEDE